MTNVDKLVARIRELEKEATKWPWEILNSVPLDTIAISYKSPLAIPFAIIQKDQWKDTREENAEFIAELRNHCKALCDIIEKQNATLAELTLRICHEPGFCGQAYKQGWADAVEIEQRRVRNFASQTLSECEELAKHE